VNKPPQTSRRRHRTRRSYGRRWPFPRSFAISAWSGWVRGRRRTPRADRRQAAQPPLVTTRGATGAGLHRRLGEDALEASAVADALFVVALDRGCGALACPESPAQRVRHGSERIAEPTGCQILPMFADQPSAS